MTATYHLTPSITLFYADCREALRVLPDNSIDSVPTDPPYALVSIVKRFGSPTAAPAKGNEAYMRASAGFMGKTWDTGETVMTVEFWREVLRVLKPGGHVAAFGSSRGYHRMACAIEDAGFEIRDSLMWCYGTGFPKSHDVSKGIDREAGAERTKVVGSKLGRPGMAKGGSNQRSGFDHAFGGDMTRIMSTDITAPATAAASQWEGWGTALKPAFEPIVLARKPLSEGTVAANVLRWGTGALNIGACRVGTTEAGGRPRIVSKSEKSLNTFGNGLNGSRADGTTSEGRWPANVLHDGSDEVVAAFPTTKARGNKGVSEDKGANADNVYAGGWKNRDCGESYNHEPVGTDGSAARFFYSAKASKADRNGSKHPTVKPISAMQWLARLITPPGGVILDPFAGSGTTGAAAQIEGFNAILCEREAEYVADILRRFAPVDSPPLAPK